MARCITLLLLSCSIALAADDFNPLSKSRDVFLKKGGARDPHSGWSCSTLVYRELLDLDSPGPKGWWRMRDSNKVHCFGYTLVDIVKPQIDTMFIDTQYVDTLAFRETEDELHALDYNKFSEIFLPPEYVPKVLTGWYWERATKNGLSIGLQSFASDSILTFPKRDFPLFIALFEDPRQECLYTEAGMTTPCKRLGFGQSYSGETMTFLEGIGLYSIVSGSNSPPHTNSSGSKIMLLRRAVGGESREFTGTLTIVPIDIFRRPGLRRMPSIPSDTRHFDVTGKLLPSSDRLRSPRGSRISPSFTFPTP